MMPLPQPGEPLGWVVLFGDHHQHQAWVPYADGYGRAQEMVHRLHSAVIVAASVPELSPSTGDLATVLLPAA